MVNSAENLSGKHFGSTGNRETRPTPSKGLGNRVSELRPASNPKESRPEFSFWKVGHADPTVRAQVPPDRLSFVNAVRILRNAVFEF